MRFWFSLIAATTVAAISFVHGANADWRDDIKVFRVGIPVGDNAAYRIQQAEPFRAYLERKLGIHVELFPATSYDAMIDAQVSDRIQYGVYSASAFASAQVICDCLEPIAVPAAEDGAPGYHAILVARADSPYRSLTDAKGARIVIGPEGSVTGHLIPLAAFATSGIEPKGYFANVFELPDAREAIIGVLQGQADLALAWSSMQGEATAGYSAGVLNAMVADGSLLMSDIRVVWQSDLIPYGPHAVRRDLPGELKALVEEAILAMPGEDPVAADAVAHTGGGGMVAATESMFEPLKQALSVTPR